MRTVISDEQRKVNGVTIRLTHMEHQAISDTAWKNRQSVSAMVRTAIFAYLKTTAGIDLEMEQQQ